MGPPICYIGPSTTLLKFCHLLYNENGLHLSIHLLSLPLSVPYGLITKKTKKRKTKIGVSIPLGKSKAAFTQTQVEVRVQVQVSVYSS